MNRQFPWYDSVWLRNFVRAKEFIAQKHPEKLPEFVQALAPLRTRPDFQVQHLQGVLGPNVLPKIRDAIASLSAPSMELHELKTFGRWVVHDNPILSELQDSMTRLVTELAQEEIESSYNFLSLYSRVGKCPVHMDSPEAKWTLDICVDQSEPWPIYFSQLKDWPEDWEATGDNWEEAIKSDPRNRFSSYTLQPGEAILFSGSSQWHYRDPLPASGPKSFCHLVFFHFIPKGFGQLIKPACWEEHFDLPGLSAVLGLRV